jgi:hypothetical protein
MHRTDSNLLEELAVGVSSSEVECKVESKLDKNLPKEILVNGFEGSTSKVVMFNHFKTKTVARYIWEYYRVFYLRVEDSISHDIRKVGPHAIFNIVDNLKVVLEQLSRRFTHSDVLSRKVLEFYLNERHAREVAMMGYSYDTLYSKLMHDIETNPGPSLMDFDGKHYCFPKISNSSHSTSGLPSAHIAATGNQYFYELDDYMMDRFPDYRYIDPDIEEPQDSMARFNELYKMGLEDQDIDYSDMPELEPVYRSENEDILVKDESSTPHEEAYFTALLEVLKGNIKPEELDILVPGNKLVDNMIRDGLRSVLETRPQMGWNDPLKIGQLSETLERIATSIGKTAEEAGTRVTSSIDTFTAVVSALGLQFIEEFKKPVIGLLVFLIVYVIMECISEHVEPGTMRILKLILGVCAVGYGMSDFVIKLATPWLAGLNVTPQADWENWTRLIFEGISIATLGAKIELSGLSRFTDSLAKIQRDKTNIEQLISSVVNWFNEVVVEFARLFQVDVTSWFLSSGEIGNFQKELNKLMAAYMADPMSISMNFADRVSALAMRVNEYSDRVGLKNVSQRVAINQLQSQIYNLQRNVADAGIDRGERYEPGLIVYAGGPGSGKTHISGFACAEAVISNFEGDEDESIDLCRTYKSQIYEWPVPAKHHDLYRGEYVIHFADLFSAKDMRGSAESEPLALIYLIGGQPLNLPAAEISKKQRLWVISGVVIACTNTIRISQSTFDSISNPDAVRRRLNECGWYIYCNPKYAQRDARGDFIIDPDVKRVVGYERDDYLYAMIDPSKVPKVSKTVLGCPDDTYFFRRHNFTTGTFVDNAIYNVPQHFEVVKRYRETKKANGELKRANLNEAVKFMIEERMKNRGAAQSSPLEPVPFVVDPTFEERQKAMAEEAVKDNYSIRREIEEHLARERFHREHGADESKADEALAEDWISAHLKRERRDNFTPLEKFVMEEAHSTSFETATSNDKSHFTTQVSNEEENDLNWFEFTCNSDEEMAQMLRTKRVFLRDLSQSYTPEVHTQMRVLLAHARSGCTFSTQHDCKYNATNFKLNWPDNFELRMKAKHAYVRLLAGDHKTVHMTKKFKFAQLIALAEMDFEEGKNKIIYLWFMSCSSNKYFNMLYYTWYEAHMLFRPYWERVEQTALQFLAQYRPQIDIAIGFFAYNVTWVTTFSGLCLFLGLPTGFHFIDRKRQVAQKKWPLEYIQQLRGQHNLLLERYTDYPTYQKSYVREVEIDSSLNEKYGVPIGDIYTIIPVYQELAPQAGWDASVRTVQNFDKVEANSYLVYYYSTDASGTHIRHPCNLVFLGERRGVMVFHAGEAFDFLADMRKESDSYLLLIPFTSQQLDVSEAPHKILWSDVVKYMDDDLLANHDLLVCGFPMMGMHSRLEKMIPPKNCVDYLRGKKNLEGTFVHKPVFDVSYWNRTTPVEVFFDISPEEVRDCMYQSKATIKLGEVEHKQLGRVFKYSSVAMRGRHSQFTTRVGDCSTPGLLTDDRKNFCVNLGYPQAAQPWLMYLHTSLDNITPHGVPIYREMFQRHFDEMYSNVAPLAERIETMVSEVSTVIAEETGTVAQHNPLELQVSHDPVTRLHTADLEVKVDLNFESMSSIKRSKCFGIDPVTRYPARTNNYIDKKTYRLVEVKINATEVYGSNTAAPSIKLCTGILHDVATRIQNDNPATQNPEDLSFDQAILGDAGHCLKPIDWSTSAGISLRAIGKAFGYTGKGKSWMLSEPGVLKPEIRRVLKRLVDDAIEKLARGERICNIYTDNIKDELLAKEKVEAGRSRLFCTADFIYLLLSRMKFGAFAGWVFKGRINNGIAIGVNVYGHEWGGIFNRLNNFSSKHIFADYGKFDKRQKALYMSVCLYGIHMFYRDIPGSRDWIIREMLWEEIVNSVHITTRNGKVYIYQWDHGNTSGNFLTAILNSYVNIGLIHMVAVFAVLIDKGINPNRATAADYDFKAIADCLCYIVLGDDVIISVRGFLLDLVNFHVYQKILLQYFGMEFTDELKGKAGDVPPYRSLEEGSFLGRKFRKGRYNGHTRIFADLRYYSVLEPVQWIKGMSDPEIEIAKFELLNLEMSNKTSDEFYSIVPRYAEECYKKYGVFPRYTDYHLAQERMVKISSDRYGFDTFLIEDTYKSSDLDKLDSLIHLIESSF